MKKRTKVVIGIGISLLILVLGGLGFAGNYFYTLAIDAHSDKDVYKRQTYRSNDLTQRLITNISNGEYTGNTGACCFIRNDIALSLIHI